MKENESDNDIETDNDDIVIVKRIKMILAPETNITNDSDNDKDSDDENANDKKSAQ